ncbi:helix-turn-helix domain-containing protein [Streptomyces sp. S1A]|uniref:helix-turn-helix transcriptional regulator n=1 Tax=Streptomyces sp. ICN903 TaxID=2964654 RepID=UPI001EDA9757|nr:helix-turn-helix domain-containing protein [Streptomyces sp. ICN903]MCG3040262.1 helix-turn-helix domain-containing protein [Streptomyces sp. ICN903]
MGKTTDERRALATPQELADYLGVPVSTLHQWRWMGIGPKGVRVGRHLRYRWGDVDRWLDEQQSGDAA